MLTRERESVGQWSLSSLFIDSEQTATIVHMCVHVSMWYISLCPSVCLPICMIAIKLNEVNWPPDSMWRSKNMTLDGLRCEFEICYSQLWTCEVIWGFEFSFFKKVKLSGTRIKTTFCRHLLFNLLFLGVLLTYCGYARWDNKLAMFQTKCFARGIMKLYSHQVRGSRLLEERFAISEGLSALYCNFNQWICWN